MQLELFGTGVVAWAATIIVYGIFGFVYSLTGLGKNRKRYGNVSYDPSEGKYPILIFAGAGALSTFFSAGFSPDIISALAVFLALVADQVRQMYQAGSESYEDNRDKGVSQMDSAAIAIRDGLEAGDPKKIMDVFNQLNSDFGQPSTKNVDRKADSMQESYQEGGARQIYEDTFRDTVETEEDVIHEPDPDGNQNRTSQYSSASSSTTTNDSTNNSDSNRESYLRAHDEDSTDPVQSDEDHYVGDGDGDQSSSRDDDVVTDAP